ncbi:hypothetical protein [Bradyrhizobium sp. UFLA05-112]
MAGLVPAIHVVGRRRRSKVVDHRDKPGDDEITDLSPVNEEKQK